MANIISLSNLNVAIIVMLGVLVFGYLLGRIEIKGISLGSSGVFIIAIIVGCLLGAIFDLNDLNNTKTLLGCINNFSNVVKNVGLVLFISAIGYTTGPVLIKTIKKGALNFLLLSAIVVIIGFGTTLLIYVLDKNLDIESALGLMVGALTSTPGLSSAESAFESSKVVIDTANAIAYPFGVLGACLFVQIMPKFFPQSLEESKKNLELMEKDLEKQEETNYTCHLDKLGLTVYCFVGIIGIILGSITIPGLNFKLTTTGGCLISGLIFSYFTHIGKMSLVIPKQTISVLKEFGLVLFLFGSGIAGGFGFIPTVKLYPIYFVYGMLITMLPMVIGFVIAKCIFKMDILTNLGAITGAMTSTPALGALSQVAQTDNVSACYTATYPLALFLLVIIPQIIKLFF